MKILSITEYYPIHPRLVKISEAIKNINKGEIRYLSYLEKIKNKNRIIKEVFYFFLTVKEINKYRPHYIICRGLKPLVYCCLLKWIGIKIIYDIPDLIPFDSKLRVYLEQKCIKKVDKIILGSRFFYKYYKNYSNKVVILENYPSKKSYKLDFDTKFNFKSEFKVISFIGFIRYLDVLKNLVDSVKNKNINLLFFGSGEETELKEYCLKNKITNVYFFGEYNYLDLYKFYNISDFIWAAYDYRENNVKYAVSNKFYESILYEKIGIYSKFTELGNYVENNQLGLTIDCFNKKEIENLINSLINDNHISIIENIKKYKNIRKLFWEDQIEELNKLREEK